MEREEKRGLEGFLRINLSGLEEKLREEYGTAYRVAREAGRIIGRVSRYWEIVSGPGEKVKVEVDPETYFSGDLPVHRVGDYLVAVDPKTLRLTLLRVDRIYRTDLLAAIGVEPPVSGQTAAFDPIGAATLTVVEAEPLVEADQSLKEPPVPAVHSLEPQAPVVDPRPEVVSALLSLPGEGVLLGALATPGGLVKEGRVPVRLPYKALLQHLLIVGTTGSGKTTLIKNMAASIYTGWRPERPVAVFIDMNEDYVQLPFPPDPHSMAGLREDPVYRGVNRGLAPPRGELILLPASTSQLEKTASAPGWSGRLEDLLEMLVDSYYERVLEPITGARPPGWARARWRGGGVRFQASVAGRTVIVAPYAISTVNLPTEALLGLLPGMSHLARDLIRRVRERYKRLHSVYPPVNALAAGMLWYILEPKSERQNEEADREGLAATAARELLEASIVVPHTEGEGLLEVAVTRKSLGGLEKGESLLDMAEKVRGILAKMLPHDNTLAAAYRRLESAVETGLMDVAVYEPATGVLRLVEEPGWEDVIATAVSERVPVVVDLKPASESGAGGIEGPRLVAYRLLQSLAWWKQKLYERRERGATILVVVDEAHQFFPQEKGAREEQEANRQVAAMISRIARLGRARGVGLVFATHSPRDLHDIIVQLSNTKIVLRTEKGQLERLELDPDLKHYVPRFPDRLFLVQSHVYRQHSLIAATSPPVVLHYDVSAQV